MLHLLIILLGCNNPTLQNNRIETGIQFALSNNNSYINWFLTGGIKNKTENTISEAEKMGNILKLYNSKNYTWNYIYDTLSENTAENIIRASTFLNKSTIEYNNTYIITSEFHYERVNKMVEKIIINSNIKWILAPLEEPDSRYWEKIHIQNVNNDIEKALQNIIYN